MIIRGLSIVVALGFFGFILWVITLANSAQQSVFFDFVASFPYGDKVGHIGLFGTLTLLVTVALNYKVVTVLSQRIYLGALLVWLFVTVEELSQGLIASRTMDVGDYLADIVGIVAATGCCYVLRRWCAARHRERALFRKKRDG